MRSLSWITPLAAGAALSACGPAAAPDRPARPVLSEMTCPDGSRWMGRPCGTAAPPALASAAPPPEPPPCGEPSGMAVRPRAQPGPARICGRLRPSPAAGAVATEATVVLVWYTPDERARFQGGRLPPADLIDALLDRGRVLTGARLARPDGLEYSIDYPGGDAVVLAVADLERAFWPTLFGSGAGNLTGVSPQASISAAGGARADVTLEPVPRRDPPAERCQGERFELVRVDAPEIAGAIGNPLPRRLCVWLPASYAKEPARRYPVVYLLPGLASGDVAYLSGSKDLRPTADALARDGAGEAILVGVDTSTRHGSAYFTDTAAAGSWARFARERMVGEIDRRFRTRATARGRGLVGHSTGGFNAVYLALRFPDLFGAVGASAPDALDLEHWLLAEDGRVRPRWLAWARLEAAVGGMGQLVSYGAAWSRDAPASGLAFPFDLESGALREDAWRAWRAESPLRMMDDPGRAAEIRRRLSGRIHITVGRRDEFGLHDPAQRFAARLGELGIEHELHSTEGGHFSDALSGLRASLAFAVRRAGSPAGPPHPRK